MAKLLSDKHQFIADHFPEARGRIALIDFSAPVPEVSTRLREKFYMLSFGDKKSLPLRMHIFRQITARDDEKKHGFLQSLTEFLLEKSLQQTVNSDTLMGMCFTGIIKDQLPVFHDLHWLDSDEYQLHQIKGAGILTYGAKLTNAAYPMDNLRTAGAAGYATPALSPDTYNDLVFLHELFHALHCVQECKPFPAPAGHINEVAADVFAVLVMASSGEYPEWKAVARTLSDLRLLNAFEGDPLHCSTRALNAAIRDAEKGLEGMTTAQAFDRAIEIAVKNPSFASDADLAKAMSIAEKKPATSVSREKLFGTGLGQYQKALETLRRPSTNISGAKPRRNFSTKKMMA